MKPAELLLHFLFPRSCPVCGACGSVICPGCLDDVVNEHVARPTKCLACGDFAPCEKHNRRFEVRALTPYSGASRDLLLRAKYRGSGLLARAMGRRMAELLGDLHGRWTIVAIPPHPQLNLLPRGDSHLEWMARGIADETAFPVSRCLKWRRKNVPQKKQPDARARRAMPRDSFLCEIPPSNVVLLDDICTTGTTLLRAAQCLYDGGSQQVVSLCWAAAE
ncbi:MAG: ComF family protein [Pyramidobacter sp.]|jgi:predicted amidophosphoribosyltransferase